LLGATCNTSGAKTSRNGQKWFWNKTDGAILCRVDFREKRVIADTYRPWRFSVAPMMDFAD
jgi:hypothetical protein